MPPSTRRGRTRAHPAWDHYTIGENDGELDVHYLFNVSNGHVVHIAAAKCHHCDKMVRLHNSSNAMQHLALHPEIYKEVEKAVRERDEGARASKRPRSMTMTQFVRVSTRDAAETSSASPPTVAVRAPSAEETRIPPSTQGANCEHPMRI